MQLLISFKAGNLRTNFKRTVEKSETKATNVSQHLYRNALRRHPMHYNEDAQWREAKHLRKKERGEW